MCLSALLGGGDTSWKILMEGNIEMTHVSSTPTSSYKTKMYACSPERGGVEFIVLFIPLPNRTKFLLEAKNLLGPPF